MANSDIERTAYSDIVLAVNNPGHIASYTTAHVIALLDHAIAWHHARLNDEATDAFIALAETTLNRRLA